MVERSKKIKKAVFREEPDLYIQRVQRTGETIYITHFAKPVAKLEPVDAIERKEIYQKDLASFLEKQAGNKE